MEPTMRFVIIISTLSLLKFQELEGVRTRFNENCAPLFQHLDRYENCGMEHLQRVKDCCAAYASDQTINCKDIMDLIEMETSLGEKLERRNIADLHPHHAIGNRHIDYAVRNVVDRDHKLQGADAQYYYVPVPLASALIGYQKYDRYNEITFVHLAGKTLIMPFFRMGRWMVMIADTRTQVVEYYDSLDPQLHVSASVQNMNTFMDTFVQMLNYRNSFVSSDDHVDTSNWVIINAIIQTRGILSTRCNRTHCGIYVLMFIDQVLNQETGTDHAAYRHYLADAIGNANLVFDSELLENRLRYYIPTPNPAGPIPSCAS